MCARQNIDGVSLICTCTKFKLFFSLPMNIFGVSNLHTNDTKRQDEHTGKSIKRRKWKPEKSNERTAQNYSYTLFYLQNKNNTRKVFQLLFSLALRRLWLFSVRLGLQFWLSSHSECEFATAICIASLKKISLTWSECKKFSFARRAPATTRRSVRRCVYAVLIST